MIKQQTGQRHHGVLRPLEVFALVNAFAIAGRAVAPLARAAVLALEEYSKQKDAPQGLVEVPRALIAAPGSILFDEPRVLQDLANHFLLWKPPFWTVSVNASDTEVANDMQAPSECEADLGLSLGGRQIDRWVAEKLSHQMPIAGDRRYACGFVHRIDRQTSGLLLVAKTYWGYYWGKLQWAALRVTKQYVCLVHGWVPGDRCRLEMPLSVVWEPRCGGWKSVVKCEGKRALTEISAVAHFEDDQLDRYSLVEIDLRTGRKHQIRAHLSHDGYPLVSDEKYGGSPRRWCPRIFLHAHYLHIEDEVQPIDARCPLPGDLRRALSCLRPMDEASGALAGKWLDQV
mmetsp:Transcript_47428/g.101520  ORF Transcript_47428/g.101520 Transcript_47428/m.101520 type:complete len:343 (+) Transcript_47428:15-1043(+)